MNVELAGNPDFGHVKFVLNSGDKVLVESGAMAVMDTDIGLKSQLMGGFVPALMRKLLAGESLLVGEYTANAPNQRLQVSPAIPGQVLHWTLKNGPPVFLQAGSFMACTPGVHLGTVFGGLKAIFSGEGMFFLKVTGAGELWLNSYGSIKEIELGHEEFIVDTGHLVGWEHGVEWSIQGMGNLFSTIFSGEGLVMRFKGPGKIWVQSRSEGGLVSWLRGYCRG